MGRSASDVLECMLYRVVGRHVSSEQGLWRPLDKLRHCGSDYMVRAARASSDSISLCLYTLVMRSYGLLVLRRGTTLLSSRIRCQCRTPGALSAVPPMLLGAGRRGAINNYARLYRGPPRGARHARRLCPTLHIRSFAMHISCCAAARTEGRGASGASPPSLAPSARYHARSPLSASWLSPAAAARGEARVPTRIRS